MSKLLAPKRAAGVDNTARRTWDKEEFRQKAEEKEKAAKAARADADDEDREETAAEIRRRKRLERDPLHQGLIVERSSLRQRDYQIDLTSRLGKTQVVGFNTPLNQQAGWFCNVCNCVLRDSQSYLDHINGKWHNRALGMSMRVEKSTLEQVKNKFEELKSRKSPPPEEYVPDGFDAAASAEAKEREEKREKRRRKAAEAAAVGGAGGDADGGDADPDMLALMGFGGFGTSKK
ncbi:hypothetical protein PLESTB_000737900 [Pleodorina starrii]|uniref:U1-type domain-containing protein n=1 Tax=Pleodorina starrii TaxID=330485 RepID=A0A9W6BJP4_9CHLO|nr:hypothetical protein PLESTM_000186400 [Pleodorina starrii]GLC53374.1 hypothetical protein PLESTB_000737900 [Pleodorina starrii]GLC67156.1 hypothetical protein PLESTF_000523200 [Pleodorina starrii]